MRFFSGQVICPSSQPTISVMVTLTLTISLASSLLHPHRTPDGSGIAPFTLAL